MLEFWGKTSAEAVWCLHVRACRWLSLGLSGCQSVWLVSQSEYLHCAKLGLSTKTGLASVAGSSRLHSARMRMLRTGMLLLLLASALLVLTAFVAVSVFVAVAVSVSVCVAVSSLFMCCCCNAPICKVKKEREIFHIWNESVTNVKPFTALNIFKLS